MDISGIKRILIIRTDRIGDVVLSTPAIAASRSAFPDAYIAVMVSEKAKEIVTGNPHINEVIVYDKMRRHRSFLRTAAFAARLKAKRFDLALILHSTVRVNLISFLARIPKRVGYARGKMDFLLTHKLEYKKRLGEKHESEYSLDVLRFLGVETRAFPLSMPVKKADEKKINALLRESRLSGGCGFIALHPGASCISKMWSCKNFAKAADLLIEKFKVSVVLVSSPEQTALGEATMAAMRHKPLFLCGRTSLGELAALLKKARLFISNDSGPVHIACAVGTPVISIFGRNEKGLGPARWRPLGAKAAVLHKDVGCVPCLAHNCKKGFLCLDSVKAEEVLEKAKALLA